MPESRPLLLVLLRGVRAVAIACACLLALIGGTIIYSIISVQNRALASLTDAESAGLVMTCVLFGACVIAAFVSTWMLRKQRAGG